MLGNFDPKDHPTAEEALADPYFKGLAKIEREPSCQPITKMEFEFERRRVTKEDIRELIFREILEYHPQLLKDYMNGTERTNFLYPSAVDQFRKSTVVHSNSVLPKEQPKINSYKDQPTQAEEVNPSRNFQATQRLPIAKPERVVGPVVPYKNRHIAKDPMPLAYCYNKASMGKQERHGTEAEREVAAAHAKQIPHSGIAAKLATDVAINIDSNPFFMTTIGGGKMENGEERAAIDAKFLAAKTRYGGIGAAAAAA
ncbi:hypothetical protein EUGRSUZ_E02127 [Eucalyptus grandis]|uniref:Uncharacterized protein n=2 Tax=Eucalyptus grandis TaxID=71139 RepID=A0ACC3KVQ1_EUCGR|nr:hypothetical protein EUGRSUZ_E02127 [Eucalyptus grandis]